MDMPTRTKTVWPKLVTGHTYTFDIYEAGILIHHGTWRVQDPPSNHSAGAFRAHIMRWTRLAERRQRHAVIKDVTNA